MPQAVTDAPASLAGLPAWLLTDGKAGDEGQCRAVADALGLDATVKRVRPRAPFALLGPRGPLDPRDRPGRAGGPMPTPYPALAIASGRRAVPYLRALRRAAGGDTFTVFLKDPRTGAGTADLIWVAEHDDLRGANVVVTLTPPHGISPARLAAARAAPDARLAALPRPRVAVLVGGDSRHGRFTAEEGGRLAQALAGLAADGAGLMMTASRRTPPALLARLRGLAAEGNGVLYAPGDPGANPYVAMLALADAILVTADSGNMVGEAVATGAPVHLFATGAAAVRHRTLFSRLAAYGAVKPFAGRLESFRYKPLDATSDIARAIADAYLRHRAARGP
jgi:uncharacterized protein